MKKITQVLLITLAFFIAGCSAPKGPGYPAEYRQALTTHTGIEQDPSAGVQRFVDLYTGLNQSNWREAAEALYAERFYFNDTLHTITHRDNLIKYFESIRAADSSIAVQVEDVIQKGADVYVRWSMQTQFSITGSGLISTDSIGISLLRFNSQGKIVFHQDFWDNTQGFYRHLPVTGSALGFIQRRMELEDE